GRGLEWTVALGVGSAGATIAGVLLTVVGVLLLTGASLGAILRRSGHAVRSAHTRVRRPSTRAVSRVRPRTGAVEARPAEPPVDVAHDYPDLVSSPAPLLVYDGDEEAEEEITLDESQPSLFELDDEPLPEDVLPERSLLRRSNPSTGPNAAANERAADSLL